MAAHILLHVLHGPTSAGFRSVQQKVCRHWVHNLQRDDAASTGLPEVRHGGHDQNPEAFCQVQGSRCYIRCSLAGLVQQHNAAMPCGRAGLAVAILQLWRGSPRWAMSKFLATPPKLEVLHGPAAMPRRHCCLAWLINRPCCRFCGWMILQPRQRVGGMCPGPPRSPGPTSRSTSCTSGTFRPWTRACRSSFGAATWHLQRPGLRWAPSTGNTHHTFQHELFTRTNFGPFFWGGKGVVITWNSCEGHQFLWFEYEPFNVLVLKHT